MNLSEECSFNIYSKDAGIGKFRKYMSNLIEEFPQVCDGIVPREDVISCTKLFNILLALYGYDNEEDGECKN